MSPFAAWDVLSVSLVLSLRFLGPFAFGVSLIAWAALRPPRPGQSRVSLRTSLLGIALGALVCLAPILIFLWPV